MSSTDQTAHGSSHNFHVLGSLWTVYGLFRLLILLCMLMYGSTVTLMFGALLSRVPDPFALMGIFHFVYTGMVALCAVSGILGFVAGLALLGGQQSARKLALVAAVCSLSDLPLGTTLGIFTLVKMLPIRAAHVYERSGQPA